MIENNEHNHKNLKPEEKARIKIDEWLIDAGWEVVSRSEYSDKYCAQAVKENLMKGNFEADYVLYLSGKAVAVIEAKKKENTLGDEVRKQAEGYTSLLPPTDQFWLNPLPFVFMGSSIN